jgi:flagellar hook-associated protein 2
VDLVGGDTWDVDVSSPILQAAADARIRVDGIYMTKSSNTISDIIEGVTLDLMSADGDTTVTVTVSNDTAAVQAQISDFVNAYNSLMTTIQAATAYNEDEEVAQPLLGDSTVASIRSSMQTVISSMVQGLSDDAMLFSLAEIGINIGSGGMLSVDSTELSDALADDFEGVVNLFVESSYSSESSVMFQSRTSATHAGDHDVEITYDADGNITSALIDGVAATVDGMIITGADGTAAEGMVLAFDAPSSGAGTVTGTVRLGLGVFANMGSQIEDINDSDEGEIHFATEDLNSRIESLSDRIASMEERLETREEMYRRQFTNLEVALSQLQSQSQYLSSIVG